METYDVVKRILDWHENKFGDDGASVEAAEEVFMEEVTEWCEASDFEGPRQANRCLVELADCIISALGVMLSVSEDRGVVRHVIAKKLDEIENRKGRIVNGKFTKESDL